MTTTHYTAIVTFAAEPEKLADIIAAVNSCIQEKASSGTEITIIAQDAE